MIAVLFEVQPREGHMQGYLDAAAALRPLLEQVDGFLLLRDYGLHDREQAPADSR